MAIAELVDLGIDLCSLFVAAFIYILTSLLATGKFMYVFLSHGLNGITAAFEFVPTCTNNGFACGLKAVRIFFWELSKFIDIYEFHTNLWHYLICLIVLFTPFLREIVLTCLTFSITLIFALFIKVFEVSRNRPRRTANINRHRSSRWVEAIVKNGFRKLKERFKTTTHTQRPPHSTERNIAFNTNMSDSSLTCLVCYENPKCVLLLPCKHACLCVDCAKNLLERQSLCPLCRKRIISVMQIYI